MKCIVCNAVVKDGEAEYANAWERSLKENPCCSSVCATEYNPDHHWLPAVAPSPPAGQDVSRIVEGAKKRLMRGDDGQAIARELLRAGFSCDSVRSVFTGVSGVQQAQAELVHKGDQAMGVMKAVNTGSIFKSILSVFSASASEQPKIQNDTQALSDISLWEKRFSD